MASSTAAVSVDTANLEFFRGNSGMVSSSNPAGSLTINSTSLKMGLGSTSSTKNFIETGGNGGANIIINPAVNFSEIGADQPLALTAFSGTAINLNGGIIGHNSFFTNVNINNDIGNDDANQTGVVTIAGTSAFNGTTTVGHGSLIVNGSYNGNNPVAVNPGATIGGTGTIGSAVNVAGNIAPGAAAIGTLTVGGNLDLSAAGNMVWKLGALTTTGPGANFDTLAVGGELLLGGASILTLDFNLLGGDAPGGGNAFWNSPHTWKIVDTSASTNGSNFAAIANGNFGSGHFIASLGTGADSGDILLNYVTATPGDFNGDGNVNGVDFSLWQNSFPTTSGGTLSTGDADGDGDVDGADFIVWQTHYPTGTQTAAVPEPAGCVMILLAAIGPLWACRAKRAK
jgi:hypothetical protein